MVMIDPGPAGAHAGQHRLHHAERAEQVDLVHRLDGRFVALLDRGDIAIAGIVHEHVDRAEPRLRGRHRRTDLRGIGDVERQRKRAIGMGGDDVRHVPRLARGDDRLLADRQHMAGDGAADAGGAAGDEPSPHRATPRSARDSLPRVHEAGRGVRRG